MKLLLVVSNIRNKTRERMRSQKIAIGMEDALDVVSYEGMEEQSDHVVLDGIYLRSLFISGYTYSASSGWLDNLVNFSHSCDITYHIEETSPAIAVPKLTRKISELESRHIHKIKTGSTIGAELRDPLGSAHDLRDKIIRDQEKLFQASISVMLREPSLEQLDKVTKILTTTLSAKMFSTRIARYRQLDGLQTVLPRADDALGQKRNLDSSSAALTFPFISSQLVHESGILFGTNSSSNSLVIIDRFGLHNANSIMFATSGSGKSYTSKIEILRQLMQGTEVIVIDPEREYENLAKSVDGTYIRLSPDSSERINPFDLAAGARTDVDLMAHIQDLTRLISLMAKSLSDREQAALDKALLKVYQSKRKRQPLLEDLYAELHKLGQLKLCLRLEQYITGSSAGFFNAPTNIKLENRLIVFDIKDMPDTLRPIMMFVVSNFIQNTVKASLKRRLLVIDEGWLLLQNEQSARFIAGLTRRARKYYLGVAMISQQANDFLENEYGRAIASQSALRILMRQDTTSIENVAHAFNLSQYEQTLLLSSGRGQALIIADQNHVSVNIEASDKEHPLITTDPTEVTVL